MSQDEHKMVDKPWGYYRDWYRSDKVVFKKLLILQGASISYQYHKSRDESWYITEGEGMLTLNDVETTVRAGDYIYIRKGQKHMIQCTSYDPLVIFEMQTGRPDEDDIVRLKDIYGRE